MLQYLSVGGPGQPGRDPRCREITFLPEVDAHHAHLAGTGIAGGIGGGGAMISVDEALDLRLVAAASRGRAILDRTGLEQRGQEED